jgi:hypothetical protein
LERKNTARTNQLGKGAQNGNWVRKKLQNETAHGSIELFDFRDFGHIGLDEAHVGQSGFGSANPGPRNRARVAFYANHLARWTNEACQEKCHVSDARTYIKNALVWTDTCVAKKSFRAR